MVFTNNLRRQTIGLTQYTGTLFLAYAIKKRDTIFALFGFLLIFSLYSAKNQLKIG